MSTISKSEQTLSIVSSKDQYIASSLKFFTEPKANLEAVITEGKVRFTILTSRLIRIEYAEDSIFEDRPSQAIWFRKQPVPKFTIRKDGTQLEILTEYLHISYDKSEQGLTSKNLKIVILETGKLWRLGENDQLNLKGTARTLDKQSGSMNLPNGLMSRNGWAIIDDSESLVFNENYWLERRNNSNQKNNSVDLYFFGYGTKYKDCLRDYCAVSGKIPLIPKYMLGNWWSRYWEYSQNELQELMEEFITNEIPLTVCIVDMDWHIVKNPYTQGWTGYTWERSLFPDPEKFFSWLHSKGLKTALNLHPRDGVHPHETAYEQFAEFMGIDPVSKEGIEFDIADPKFTQGYFKFLHHPLEKIGVDFWWMDWQQGTTSKIEGLDPLWWLNHLHYYDLKRDNVKRPVIFSRWGGWGNHRYPIGFSGDTHITWNSLAFQPYFTSTAANAGYSYWSHDIGGHYYGMEDPELYLRWVQFGVFSPIFRLHSTKSRFCDRRPWGHGSTVFEIAKKFMQLRHTLIPYIYTMCKQTEDNSLPLSRPMYYEHPEQTESYYCENQYYFGTELIVAPFISKSDPITHFSKSKVWFPDGDWYDFFTGEYFSGGCFKNYYGNLESTPVFAKAGAIIPLTPLSGNNSLDNPETFELHVFAGANNEFTLYEDDGETTRKDQNEFCHTQIEQKFYGNSLEITINPAQGKLTLIPQNRKWTIHLYGIVADCTITVLSKDINIKSNSYDTKKECLTFTTDFISINKQVSFRIETLINHLLSRRERLEEKLRDLIYHASIENIYKGNLDNALLEIITNPSLLQNYVHILPDSLIETLYQMITDSGYIHVKGNDYQEYLHFWNNKENKDIRLAFQSFFKSFNLRDSMPKNLLITFDRENTTSKSASLWKNEKWSAVITYFNNFSSTIVAN